MTTILYDDFFLLSDGSKCNKCSVRLTTNYLSYKNTDADIKMKNNFVSIPVNDMIGCNLLRNRPLNQFYCYNNDQILNEITAYVCIYCYIFKSKGKFYHFKNTRISRKTVYIAINKFDNLKENLAFGEKWQNAILWLIRGFRNNMMNTSMIETSPKTRNLLVLVNPASGSGKALQIFDHKVIPLMCESNTQYELIVTEEANSAQNLVVNNYNLLDKYDGIVVISGDGLLFEIINGIMQRPDWEKAIKIPIGIIPGGSGNGLAHSINFALKNDLNDNSILTSTLNVVCGKISPMDLVRIKTPKGIIYSFLSIGWGLMADIDIESERLRILGEIRFTLWALYLACASRKYRGRVSYKPIPSYNKSYFLNSDLPKNSTQSIVNSSLTGVQSSNNDLPQSDANNTEFLSNNVVPSECTHEEIVNRVNGVYDGNSCNGGNGLNQVNETTDWVVIDGDFIVVYASYQTHLNSGCFFAPNARIDDGIIWLLMLKGDLSRAQVLKFLTCLESGTHINLPFVDMVPVTAFKLEPFNNEGRLTIDGELIQCGTIEAQILPSIARIMTR